MRNSEENMRRIEAELGAIAKKKKRRPQPKTWEEACRQFKSLSRVIKSLERRRRELFGRLRRECRHRHVIQFDGDVDVFDRHLDVKAPERICADCGSGETGQVSKRLWPKFWDASPAQLSALFDRYTKWTRLTAAAKQHYPHGWLEQHGQMPDEEIDDLRDLLELHDFFEEVRPGD